MAVTYTRVIPVFEVVTYARAYGFVIASLAIQRLADCLLLVPGPAFCADILLTC